MVIGTVADRAHLETGVGTGADLAADTAIGALASEASTTGGGRPEAYVYPQGIGGRAGGSDARSAAGPPRLSRLESLVLTIRGCRRRFADERNGVHGGAAFA